MTAQPQPEPSHASIRLPVGRSFTPTDLDELPDGTGFRFELVDGTLIVSPAPYIDHQRWSRHFFRLLDAACPPGLDVFYAPLAVRPGGERGFEPDIVVGRSDDFGPRHIVRPLLHVEIASRSTRLVDRHLKRAAYEEAGIASYWLVDPVEPAMTVLALRAGRYVEVASISADEAYDATVPFPVRVTLR